MQADSDFMVTDHTQYESQDSSEATQQTQSTQQASQSQNGIDSHLWGFLQPCSAALTRIDFWKIKPRYTIGRHRDENEIVMPGFKVSNFHCVITWDGKEDHTSLITVQDLSSNGTFINGAKIGKGQTRILREGNEIAFGTCTPQPANQGIEDYRFVYRHTAAGPPSKGLYASYDLGNELGKGSFATVMKAINRQTGIWYAVKMIHDRTRNNGGTQANSTQRTNAYVREISIMEKMKHPNICELKEVFWEDNGDINLVLELVEGGDLLTYIQRHDAGLTEGISQHITYQMCDALAYVHDQGVTHRDLKPENVLLTSEDPPRVKIADFGLAKVVDSLTMLRTMCGTPSYLAPEVVAQQNQEGYDSLVDSWSVGVIVFSMLTNSGCFIEDENQRDIRMRILEREIDWSVMDMKPLSQEVHHFVRRLLDTDPSRRMTLAGALFHPWLLAYTPIYPTTVNRNIPNGSSSSSIPNDYSMLSSVAEEPAGSQYYQPPGAFSSNAQSGIRRESSRTTPLQRRAQVLAEAAEGVTSLPEPSWEMINAASQSEQQAGPSNHKRVFSELTPLSEIDDAEMDDVEDQDDGQRQGSDDESKKGAVAGRGGRGGRGRGKGANGGVTKNRSAARNEDEATTSRPRRSTRQSAQKQPRFN